MPRLREGGRSGGDRPSAEVLLPQCRRELPRLRRHLADLEADLAEACYQLSVREGVWRDSYQREVAWLIPRVEAARQRIPEEM